MQRLFFMSVIIGIFTTCASPPEVKFSQLEISSDNHFENGKSRKERLSALIKELRGLQFGDIIFKENTAAYWILPEIDKLDLEITSQEERFGVDEYQARLKRINDLHRNFLIFSLDLRMPFNPDWTQSKLLNYLQANLFVTLENGINKTFVPERQIFQVIERFQKDKPAGSQIANSTALEVHVPVRVYFKKKPQSGPVILNRAQTIMLKLRLKENPPFRIGFWDDKFYQGFKWKILPVID